MQFRILILLPFLTVLLSNEKVFSQWAVIPGLVSARYFTGPVSEMKGIGSCVGIESQIYGNYIIAGFVCNTGTNEFLEFSKGHFIKLALQFGVGNYKLGGKDNLRGFGAGISGGLLEASNGLQDNDLYDYSDDPNPYDKHYTGLGLGIFANAALSRNIQFTYNYDFTIRINFVNYDVNGDFVLHTLSLKLFRWVSLNYSRFSDPPFPDSFLQKKISRKTDRINIPTMKGNYWYLGLIITIDNHKVIEKIFFPNGY